MDLVENVKNWWGKSQSIDDKDMVEFRQSKIDLIKGEISKIIDDIDLNDESHVVMKSATDDQIEKGMSGGESLKDHIDSKYKSVNDRLVKSLGSKKEELRWHEGKLNKTPLDYTYCEQEDSYADSHC